MIMPIGKTFMVIPSSNHSSYSSDNVSWLVVFLFFYICLSILPLVQGFVDAEYDDLDDLKFWHIILPAYFLGFGLYKLFNIKIWRNK